TGTTEQQQAITELEADCPGKGGEHLLEAAAAVHDLCSSCSRICSATASAVTPRSTTGGEVIRRRAYSRPDIPRHASHWGNWPRSNARSAARGSAAVGWSVGFDIAGPRFRSGP